MFVGQEQSGGELATGFALGDQVRRRVDQHLQERGDVFAAHLLGDHRRQVAAGAVTGHRDPVRGDAPGRGLGHGETPRGESIVDSRRERVFGCEAVLDRQDVGTGRDRQAAGEIVVGGAIALDESTAMEEDDDAGRVDLRAIPRRRDRDIGAVDDQVLLDRHRREILGHRSGVGPQILSGLRDRFAGEIEGGQGVGDPAGQRHLGRESVAVGIDPPALADRSAQQRRRHGSRPAHHDALNPGGDTQ